MRRRTLLQSTLLSPLALSLPHHAFAQDAPDAPRPVGPVPMCIGLNGVNDWSPEQPFLDVMKTARTWIGHKPGQWGGAGHADLARAGYLDDHGWPMAIPPELRSIGTVVLTDLPEKAASLKGRYVLRFEGDGIVEVSGRGQNVRYGRNEVSFDFTPGDGAVIIRIQRTDRSKSGDYVRNITIVREEHLRAFDAGAVFNPDFLRILEGFKAVRFMDWMLTNETPQTTWDSRPQVSDYTYGLRGVPAEVMLDLANRIGVDAWFNIPHTADDGFVQRFATLARNTLWHDLHCYMEFSNEVWNWQFPQARWADDMAKKRWGKDNAWVQYYALRAAEVARLCAEVFDATGARDRLINVISSQTGWLGLEADIFEPPLLTREQPDSPSIASAFDAYAITGYFGGGLGTEDRAGLVRQWLMDSLDLAEGVAAVKRLGGTDREAYVADHKYDAATALAWAELRDGLASGEPEGSLSWLIGTVFPHHAEVAKKWGLDLVMYEGGTHVVGIGPMVDADDLTDFFTHLNYTAEMGTLYTELINGWHAAGGGMFNVFSDVNKPGKWGSWGALRHLSDDNPRWEAIRAFL
ncbi:hypothetical protein [Pseudodonghicola xiamenensis]|uniref:Uncharacterized protein n=1 Tax=Pseudodonghicola xiamenensis TaxID=337702 RepID=A0A8J3H949_9RHOB|nr:hypothetical protein [Pseudodonghicola xiamenensis]GHG93639.1 hypothetical protein GCM10010961_26250 [Pseudodonghicola xiamenensis]